ncbi:MAG: HAMP domain-containing protein [Magnetococcales bacterium]|nr:HAMP domain-containing protein [Magnetococcales bacterium]MBF0116174.1 HAMP domain-containing protein [Magnetococcales bacterium]
MLARIRISSKLAFTIAFTLFFFIAVTAAYTFILHHTLRQQQTLRDRELRVQQLANEVAIQMLQARRLEKDFMLRKEVTLVESVRKAVQSAIRQAEEMIRLGQAGQDEAVLDKAQQIVLAMNGYLQAFQGMADGYQQLGLHDEEGLQATVLQASRALERWLRWPEAVPHIVQLWNSEKGYWLGRDNASALEVHNTLQQLRTLFNRAGGKILGKADETLLQNYAQHWEALLTRERQTRLQSETMRSAIHAVEPLIDEIRQVSQHSANQMAASSQTFGERAAVFLLLLSLLTVAICAVVCGIIIQSIARSLKSLQHFAQAVSAGDWDAVMPVEGCDELGRLADAMRTMVDQVRTVRLLSDRLVLILLLIGRGTLPARVDPPQQGEVKAVGDALNQVVDTLSAMQPLAEQLECMAQGKTVAPLPEALYPGEFKRLALATNQLLARLQHSP